MRLGVLFVYFLIKFDENNVIVIVAMNVVEKWGGGYADGSCWSVRRSNKELRIRIPQAS